MRQIWSDHYESDTAEDSETATMLATDTSGGGAFQSLGLTTNTVKIRILGPVSISAPSVSDAHP
jgi:hypothetical protein